MVGSIFLYLVVAAALGLRRRGASCCSSCSRGCCTGPFARWLSPRPIGPRRTRTSSFEAATDSGSPAGTSRPPTPASPCCSATATAGTSCTCWTAWSLFQQMGLSCLVFDYRGYGNSEGSPDEAGTYLDARAAFDWLTQVKRRARRQDHSLRPVPGRQHRRPTGCRGAAARPWRSESAFTSYPDIGARLYPLHAGALVRPVPI